MLMRVGRSRRTHGHVPRRGSSGACCVVALLVWVWVKWGLFCERGGAGGRNGRPKARTTSATRHRRLCS